MAGYGQAAGAAFQIASDIMGLIGKSKARSQYPMWNKMDLGSEVNAAAKTNEQNLEANKALVQKANTFNQDQLTAMLEKAMPGYAALQKQQSGLISDMLSGKLPQGTVDEINRSSAAYGVSSGTKGSQFAGYRGLRQLGIASMQYAQQGLSAADRWIARTTQTGMAQPISVASMFVSPMQQAQWDLNQNVMQHESRLGKWSLGNSALDWQVALQSAANTAGSFGGGGMIGGGGKGGGAPSQGGPGGSFFGM